MELSENGVNILKKFENFSATPYKDVVGKLTIGYGHLVKPGEVFGAVSSIEALNLLKKDVWAAQDIINKAVTVPLTQNQFDALVSFVYNIGGTNFLKSTMLRKLNEGKHDEAAKEFLRWNMAGGKVVQGLTNRRKAEQELFQQV